MPAWRETYRPARFFVLDARILFLIIPTVVWPRVYTLVPTLAVGITLFFVERRLEMSLPSAARALRSFAVSKVSSRIRPARPYNKLRQQIDYDRVD